jgi:DNA-binding response OmpR family regulator
MALSGLLLWYGTAREIDLRAASVDQTIYRFGGCILDSANRRFTRDGNEYDLEPKVFAVLVQLIARPAELVTREQLLDAVWGTATSRRRRSTA